MYEDIFTSHGHMSEKQIGLATLAEVRMARAEQASQFHFLNSKINNLMSAATDLQTLVDQLTASQAGLKTSLDTIKTGVATIVAGIPAGGMTADEVAALKTSLTTALTTEQANASEASDDAAAVSAAQPAAPATT